MKIVSFFIALFFSFQVLADIIPELTAGPMQGHTTATSTAVWIMVQEAENVSVTLKSPSGEMYTKTASTAGITSYRDHIPMTFGFDGLTPATTYNVVIKLDDKTVKVKNTVYTLDNDPNKPYSFIVVSCALTVPVGFRFMHPGIEDRTYKFILKHKTDFSLWLGDYLYYLPKNYKSPYGMGKRFAFKRTRTKIMEFMVSRPQYSIWDDHDYGSNDADGSYKYKVESLEIFKSFWPNPYPENPPVPGNYFNFTQKDSEFFMTDCRYYRTEGHTDSSQIFGAEQLGWLKEQLLISNATFKFIAVGSQVLNRENQSECCWHYQNELNELFDFIVANKINGVLFLTGDRHHSELIKLNDIRGCYPLYDFTSSGVTTFRRRTRRMSEKNNADRVDGTLADFQNFGKITVKGENDERHCVLEIFNKRGKPVWAYKLYASELQFK